MKKILLISLLVLFLVSCGTQTTGRPGFVDVHVGNQGLQAQFVDSAPPNRVKQNQFVPIYMELSNVGASDITRGYYKIQGIDRILSISPTIGTFNLEGRSLGNPIGDRTMIQIEGQTGSLNPRQDTDKAFFEVQFCYPYETIATVEVCIDTDYLGEKQEQKTCTPRPISLGGRGQGGPVAITSVETHKALPITPEQTDRVVPFFTIKLRNVGRGKMISVDDVSRFCGQTGYQKETKTLYLDFKLSDQDLECQIEDKLGDTLGTSTEVKEEELTVICYLPEGISTRAGTYEALLQIFLEYGYVQKISKTLTVTKK